MKPQSDEFGEPAVGHLSRRQAIQRIGGGLLAAVVLPNGLPIHNATGTFRRSTDPLSTPDLAVSGAALGPAGASALPRSEHTTTPLKDGRLFITGGRYIDPLSSSEIYDPMSGQRWSASSLKVPRYGHSAALLPDGRVLVAGGFSGVALSGVETYDPAVNLWSAGPSLGVPRYGHTAVSLPNGYVLVMGGQFNGPLSSIEAYDPFNDRWSIL